MSQPWKSAPAPSSQFQTANYVGELVFVCIGGVHETFSLNGNNVPAARTNIVILTGPEQGREWTDALLFGVITVDQCRAALAEAAKAGQQGWIVLGRVRARRGNNNRDMYYVDNEITPYDEQIAQSWDAAFPGKLVQLQHQAVLLYQAEESKQGGGQPAQAQQQAQAAPPPPPPPPAAPPTQEPAAAPPWGAVASGPPTPVAQPVTTAAAPAWPATPATPNAHILGGPAQPGDTSTPGY